MTHTTRRLAFLVAALLVGVMVAIVARQPIDAEAAEVFHPSLAPESPRRDVPIVLDGTVWSTIQLQDRVILAGEFTQVESTRNGPVVTRSNMAAYDINTGELIADFAPQVNGEVFEMVASDDGDAVFIGGAFTQVDGEWRVRLAKIGYDGSLDPTFRAEANAKVLALDAHDGVLYLGGSFTEVNAASHDRIGAVDADTGQTITTFDLRVQGDVGKANTRAVKALDVHPDGDRLLVVFNGQQLVDRNGPREDNHGAAFVRLSDYTVTDWQTDWFRLAYPRCSQGAMQLRDGEFSPDGSMFVIVEKGNWTCDKAIAFDTADDGTNDPKWVTAMHDSTFSVAVTNNAVYVGGHFCFVTPHGPIDADAAPNYPWVSKPEGCETGGNTTIGEFVARYQIAALDPQTGAPLDWDPRSNAQEAVFHIEAIDRGLLIGQDQDRLNTIRTGHHAFLDFGGVTPPFEPPTEPTADCQATVLADGTVNLEWNALDDVDSWTIRRNDSWVANTPATTFSEAPGAGSFEYVIRYRQNGTRTDATCSPSPVVITAPTPACTATLNGSDVTLTWVDQPGVTDWQVRRNGAWHAQTSAETFVDTGLAVGTYDYVIRHRSNGQRIDTTCSPTITVAGPTLTCSAVQNGANATISWNALPNVSSYQVRKDGSWLATVTGTSHVDAAADPASTYQVRYRLGGVTSTIDCA